MGWLALSVIGTCLVLGTSTEAMEVWLTTGDGQTRLQRQADLGNTGNPQGMQIRVSSNDKEQSIKGFGAALSNAAAWLLYTVPNDRYSVLRDLFDAETGIGISYIRLVMGGSDFNAVEPYTYNDNPPGGTDFNMDHFSIAKDMDFMIPLIHEIKSINPSIEIMASPWSPPAWMKNPQSLNGGSLRSGANYRQALAEYFVKFVQAYANQGIRIDTVTLQNEPEHATGGYPTMRMGWEDQRDVVNYLGPRFQQEGIDTEIVIFDHNWDMAWYPMNILNDAQARQWVGGSGWHCYGGNRWDPLSVFSAHPDKDIYFTECSGGEWDPDFGSSVGWQIQNLFIAQTRIFARTVLLWNLALDDNHGPRVGVSGGCSDCRGVLTIHNANSYSRELEYYSIGHFSKFVPSGSRRVQSTTYDNNNGDLETVAFETPHGDIAIIVLNTSWGEMKTFYIEIDSQFYNYQLGSRSVTTFIHKRPA